ncbi:MAG: aconitase/3-isopropylmalate dehydratase large subunit family protein [Marinilabiliaceae bacterium]|nr:aconitase/3-isopropylmalate dehydratase large subunit family protein [Marinilabiliaceae bacterium]
MTIIEKILAAHSKHASVKAGDIIDVEIDARAARDFGGANVVKNIREYGLDIDDSEKTMFTFDCNPTGSDQKYAVNQHICRLFAREKGIRVYDIDAGIGTHILIDEGYVYPGATAVSTDSHANILGAVGAFGQGMGDMDIAASWNKGKVWFKVPESVKIILKGSVGANVMAKDIVLNLLKEFGANTLLGYSIELYGAAIDLLDLDDRITIASMATEMGAIIILIPPNKQVVDYCMKRAKRKFEAVYADDNAEYTKVYELDAATFEPMVSRPGKPHDTVAIPLVKGIKIDSAFIGSCTNGRIEDMRATARVLEGKKVAPGVILKIVPATDDVWKQCLDEGLIDIFKKAGALVSNAGCAGCAAGQVGQNGPGEITISTGNRNFPGKQGKGDVYLASPSTVAASAIAGVITSADSIPEKAALPQIPLAPPGIKTRAKRNTGAVKQKISGRCWIINEDNIDTDMIFHNRYLAITDINEMGQYTFDNLPGYENFAREARKGDIVFAGKNFGSGSSRQQAVDCFRALGIQAIVAESFGAIYERNAINAAFPLLSYSSLGELELKTGDEVSLDLKTGELLNNTNMKKIYINPFSEVQMDIYMNGGLL